MSAVVMLAPTTHGFVLPRVGRTRRPLLARASDL